MELNVHRNHKAYWGRKEGGEGGMEVGEEGDNKLKVKDLVLKFFNFLKLVLFLFRFVLIVYVIYSVFIRMNIKRTQSTHKHKVNVNRLTMLASLYNGVCKAKSSSH